MNEDPTLPIGAESFARAELPPRAASWGGFNLIARVGSGGFGEVYRAWDPSLQREVALKLLLPGDGDGARQEEAYETTLREARALASVRHPNIVSIYGVDRHDGRVGFWTDFVKGKTLSAILGDHGPYGYREAALIGLDVTRALSAVHRAGLLHCDIKPENVMREEGGRILLMDFGLSTLPQRGDRIGGTPNYMAPELLRGQPPSVASDIHAVGVLLYFLVTGAHPVKLSGLTLAEAAEASQHRTPLVDYRADLPDSFIRVVNRAIDLDPAKRFSSAGQMAEALAECVGVSSAPTAAVAVAVPAPAANAVIPAKEKNRDKEKKPRTTLQKVGLALIALAFVVKSEWPKHESAAEKPPTPPIAGAPGSSDRYLKAQALLVQSYKDSNVAAAVDQFEQLTRADPKYALGWAGLSYGHYVQYAKSHDEKLLDDAKAEAKQALALDDETAQADVTLARLAALAGQNSVAMDFANDAIDADPTNADAYRAQSAVYDAEEKHEEAIKAAQRAIDLAPDDWRGPNTLGQYLLSAGKLDEAAVQFERSARLAPENKAAYYELGVVDMRLNKLEDARTNIEHALKIEPDAGTYQELAWLLIAEHQYSQAVDADQKAVDLQPTDYHVWANLGASVLQLPDGEAKAIPAYRKAAELAEAQRKKEPKDPELLASLAYYYARSGNPDRSRTMLRQALALSSDNPKVNYVAGEIYEILGERAKAIDFISKSVGPGYSLAEIDRDPDLKKLRADPAFQAKLRAMQATQPKTQ